jgi:5'-nucleotidase
MGTIGVLAGTPADCVRIGLQQAGGNIDCVLSGINRGANIGLEVYYSGTVAAAREGTILGVPSLAISQFFRKSLTIDWDRAADWASPMIKRLLQEPHQPGVFWNVNLPAGNSDASPERMRWAPLCLEPVPVHYSAKPNGDGTEYLYRGQYEDRPRPPGSDVDLVFAGHITVTRLQLDVTSG